MEWRRVPLSEVAPACPADIEFPPTMVVWHLGLEHIESHTGAVTTKVRAPAGEAGNSTFAFDQGNVLYSKLRPYLNKVVVPDEPGIGTTELIPLRPRPHLILREYLAYYLRSPAFVSFASQFVTGAKMPRVILDKFWAHSLPLPPLSEQRRIVEILDQADRLRRLRTEADAKTDLILSALFIKMFGDPATNPKGWPVRRLGDICEIVSGGTPKTDHPEYWNGGIPWATPKDLSGLNDWVLESTERTITKEGLANSSARMMPAETVLLSSRAPIGLVAVSAVPICTNQGFKNLVCGPEVDPWYLFAWCRLRTSFLQSLGRGATFREISKQIVEAIQLPLPPLEAQRKLRMRLLRLRAARRQGRTASEKISRLFDRLLTSAFSGELTASWREAHMKELLQEMEEQTKALEAAKA